MIKAATTTGAVQSQQKKLLALARKRLQRFATLIPKVLLSDNSETVHDLRVASRRLQQALRALDRGSKTPKSKKVFRLLRQTRQAFGACRNLDVNLDLIRQRQQRAGAAVQRAWGTLRADLEAKRLPLMGGARRKLQRRDLFAFVDRAQALIEAADGSVEPGEALAEAVAKSMTEWQRAFAAANQQRDEAHLHQFRVAGKKLRYRVELLMELGETKTKPMVEALKDLQNALGDWHDREMLVTHVAQYIGAANFLADHPDLGRALLTEMEKEKLQNSTAIDQLLRDAAKVPEIWARCKSPMAWPRASLNQG